MRRVLEQAARRVQPAKSIPEGGTRDKTSTPGTYAVADMSKMAGSCIYLYPYNLFQVLIRHDNLTRFPAVQNVSYILKRHALFLCFPQDRG